VVVGQGRQCRHDDSGRKELVEANGNNEGKADNNAKYSTAKDERKEMEVGSLHGVQNLPWAITIPTYAMRAGVLAGDRRAGGWQGWVFNRREWVADASLRSR
jgi:hypothetical protein